VYEFSIVCATHGLVNGTTHPEISGGGIFGTVAPTQCPLGYSDTILETRIINTISQDAVVINDTDPGTGGYMETAGYSLDVPAGNTGDVTRFEIPIEMSMAVFQFHVLCEEENKLDRYDMYAGPTNYVGALTANVSSGDTCAYLSSFAMTLYQVGFTVAYHDGTHTMPLGRIKTIDSANGRVFFREPVTVSKSAGSPVFLWATRGYKMCMSNRPLIFGISKAGGSHIPAGYTCVFFYTNNTGEEKKFKFVTEDMY
jgi:hypothetical protein